MVDDLAGKHVVVTGGTGALGAAVCGHLLGRGAHCHVPTRRAFSPDSFALASHDRVTVAPGIDLANEAAVTTFFAGLPPLWASIHVAGGFAASSLVDTSIATFDKMMKINATSCFLSCREAVRKMRESGGGRIVNVASRSAVEPTAGMIAYVASKAVVVTMTHALAEELKDEGISVNAIVPSTFDTPANRAAMPDADFDLWPKPEQIAQTVGFLVSAAADVTSGAIVPVYGRA